MLRCHPLLRIPVNTHGGNLSEAYLIGITHIREQVEQLRGNALNQVVDADSALITGGPAAIPPAPSYLGGDEPVHAHVEFDLSLAQIFRGHGTRPFWQARVNAAALRRGVPTAVPLACHLPQSAGDATLG